MTSAPGSDSLRTTQADWERRVQPDSPLTAAQAGSDIRLLLYALRRAYGGYRFLPPGVMEKTEATLNALAHLPTSARALCESIDRALDVVPDAHLRASLPGLSCFARRERTGAVGANVAASSARPWVFLTKMQTGHSVGVLGIKRFPPLGDSSWAGFNEALAQLSAAAAVIVDLRGNEGGDDTQGYHLAGRLFGGPAADSVVSRTRRQTPEALIVQINGFRAKRQRLVNAHGDPKPLEQLIADYGGRLALALAGALPAEVVDRREQRREGPLVPPYRGAVYVLADASCGSSGESTLDALRSLPRARVVGEYTAGYLHFGNVGLVLLPFSGIRVQMGTQFTRFRNDQMYEKTGIPPTIALKPGTDALQQAMLLVQRDLGP